MKRKHTILIGKTVKKVAALRGGGSALPGLVVEKLDKHFLAHSLKQLPQGVVLITGTNGKTTTTKIVAQLLEACGLKVFTNRTGSNFTRGVVAALLGAVDRRGNLPYDIAVLELDEAYAAQFVKQYPPNYVLVLNVMRDQLDRFGEIDHTARLLTQVVSAASDTVVLNQDDPRVAAMAKKVGKNVSVRYFGADTKLHQLFVSDDQLHALGSKKALATAKKPVHSSVALAGFKDNTAQFKVGSQTYQANLKLTGVYNFLNAAGALVIVRIIRPKTPLKSLVAQLETIEPAFGRGEKFNYSNAALELILVKNPAGFRLALSSFDPTETSIMIAINDRYADGRDMSWLWDVDFSRLQSSGVSMVSGIRAYDMALRLQYDEVTFSTVDPNLKTALKSFLLSSDKPKRIFCTYTAMLALRRELKNYVKVEHIV